MLFTSLQELTKVNIQRRELIAPFSPLNNWSKLVTNFNYSENEFADLWLYLKHHVHPDFYLTENNRRVFITDIKSLKRFINQSSDILVSRNKEIDGVIALWKGLGGITKRKYIKINSVSSSISDKLLTSIIWNTNYDLYMKIKKDSPYLNTFRRKRFDFVGGRGQELLLIKKKEDKRNVRNFKQYRN